MLAAAVTVAAERGPDAIGLREIARQVGVTPSAAYRHFANRDELVEAVRLHVLGALQHRLRAGVGAVEPADPTGRLRAAGEAYVGFAVHEPMLFQGMSSGFSVGEDGWSGTPLGDLVDLVRATHPEMDDPAVTERAVALWSSVHGFAILVTQGALRDLPQERRDQLLATTLDLVLGQQR